MSHTLGHSCQATPKNCNDVYEYANYTPKLRAIFEVKVSVDGDILLKVYADTPEEAQKTAVDYMKEISTFPKPASYFDDPALFHIENVKKIKEAEK